MFARKLQFRIKVLVGVVKCGASGFRALGLEDSGEGRWLRKV